MATDLDLLPPAGVRLIGRASPFRAERVEMTVPSGLSLAEMLELAAPGVPAASREHGRLTIGDQVIPPELWARVRPKAGTAVSFLLAPQGGGSLLRTILSLALVVAASVAGNAIGGSAATIALLGTTGATIAGAVATAGIPLTGSLLPSSLLTTG